MRLKYISLAILIVVNCLGISTCLAKNNQSGDEVTTITVTDLKLDPECSGPGLYHHNIRAVGSAPTVTLLNFLAPGVEQRNPCELIRFRRQTARIGFISSAVIGTGLIVLGLDKAFQHLLSDSNAGAFESAAGLFLLAGSAVGYAVVIPHLNKRYRNCRQ